MSKKIVVWLFLVMLVVVFFAGLHFLANGGFCWFHSG